MKAKLAGADLRGADLAQRRPPRRRPPRRRPPRRRPPRRRPPRRRPQRRRPPRRRPPRRRPPRRRPPRRRPPAPTSAAPTSAAPTSAAPTSATPTSAAPTSATRLTQEQLDRLRRRQDPAARRAHDQDVPGHSATRLALAAAWIVLTSPRPAWRAGLPRVSREPHAKSQRRFAFATPMLGDGWAVTNPGNLATRHDTLEEAGCATARSSTG